MLPDLDDLFEHRVSYPSLDYKDRFDRLVGLDDHKQRLVKMLGILVNSGALRSWADRYHPNSDKLVDAVLRRPPLVVLAGDVGTGKTELAETVGDVLARQEDIDVTLFPLSLSTRGQGRVGEMTQLLSAAFDSVLEEAGKLKCCSGRPRGAVILLIDEADALAQSRAADQMHHEDRAGVNAFIRGVDRIANSQLPVAVIMCTNRLGALDPAVRRRAADILVFYRPDADHRFALLYPHLTQLSMSDPEIKAIVEATGERSPNDYGFTYSDLMQRLLPTIVLDAYPERAVTAVRALEIAREMDPTSPFGEITP